ncbi:thioredoxin-disulfide reductase, partial [Candidatus Woesearchaeota archaeon]|nr:thioredoxin-disulfide reductase [Candidatus Woesearchaeota archaeon]
KSGFIITDKEQRTNINGFYSAGDVTDNVLKQIITACGEGSVAVLSAYRDLKKK